MMALSKEVLHMLACPKCRGDLTCTDKRDGLVCGSCRLSYPIRNDIPILRVDEAEPLPQGRSKS